MRICLLNASNPRNIAIEYDEYIDYRGGIDSYFSGNKILKKCTSWHSWPASLETEFFVYGKPGWQKCMKYDGIVVCVNRDIDAVKPLVKKLKTANKKVMIAYHENLSTFLKSSENPNFLVSFKSLVGQSDGYLNIIKQSHTFFQALLDVKVHSILHGAPYNEWAHSLTIPRDQRKGIIIGTRTIGQILQRNTWVALVEASQIAKRFDNCVTYLNEDPPEIKSFFDSLGLNNINVIKGPLAYEDWLSLIAQHKLLIHFDTTRTLGQVVTDAALVGVLAVGGNTDNNRANGTDRDYLASFTPSSLNEDVAVKKLKEKTSFEKISSELREVFEK